MQAATTKSIADFDVVARIEITALTVIPFIMCGISFPDHLNSRIAITIEHIIDSMLAAISGSHVSLRRVQIVHSSRTVEGVEASSLCRLLSSTEVSCLPSGIIWRGYVENDNNWVVGGQSVSSCVLSDI